MVQAANVGCAVAVAVLDGADTGGAAARSDAREHCEERLAACSVLSYAARRRTLTTVLACSGTSFESCLVDVVLGGHPLCAGACGRSDTVNKK